MFPLCHAGSYRTVLQRAVRLTQALVERLSRAVAMCVLLRSPKLLLRSTSCCTSFALIMETLEACTTSPVICTDHYVHYDTSLCTCYYALPQDDRREIEGKLFSGNLLGVTATSALELGIDIGELDVTLHLGMCVLTTLLCTYMQYVHI